MNGLEGVDPIFSERRLGPLPVSSRVLIIDDEQVNIRLLDMALRDVAGLRVISTTDPTDATRLYLEHHPDIVLVDLHMPAMNGIEVMTALHEMIPEEEFVPIMVLTADITRQSRETALRAGAHDFLVKPLDPTEVALRVSNILRTRALYSTIQENRAQLADRLRQHEERQRVEDERIAALTWQIRDVVSRRALTTAYQPIIHLADGAVVGHEALSRFPDEPIRSPDKWFAQADELGLACEFELLAADVAVQAVARIPANQFLTLNISPKVLVSDAFTDFAAGLDGPRIIIECTEHARIEDYAPLVERLADLRVSGFRFAVDDAGAGFGQSAAHREASAGVDQTRHRVHPRNRRRPRAAGDGGLAGLFRQRGGSAGHL